MLDSCFSQLEWKIAETKKDGDTAVVTVDITNKDFSNVMQEIFSEMMAQAFAVSIYWTRNDRGEKILCN